jgi:hypothetical protein
VRRGEENFQFVRAFEAFENGEITRIEKQFLGEMTLRGNAGEVGEIRNRKDAGVGDEAARRDAQDERFGGPFAGWDGFAFRGNQDHAVAAGGAVVDGLFAGAEVFEIGGDGKTISATERKGGTDGAEFQAAVFFAALLREQSFVGFALAEFERHFAVPRAEEPAVADGARAVGGGADFGRDFEIVDVLRMACAVRDRIGAGCFDAFPEEEQDLHAFAREGQIFSADVDGRRAGGIGQSGGDSRSFSSGSSSGFVQKIRGAFAFVSADDFLVARGSLDGFADGEFGQAVAGGADVGNDDAFGAREEFLKVEDLGARARGRFFSASTREKE